MSVTMRAGYSQVQGSLPAYVKLQASTPGTAQSGHVNVTGTGIFGTVKATSLTVSSGAALGRILTSDGVGNASWAPFTIPLPYAATGSASGTGVFSMANSSATAGSCGLFGIALSGSGTYGVFGENKGSGFGVVGTTKSDASAGVYGENGGVGYGVWGDNSGNGPGIYGSSAFGDGIVGQASDPNHFGVQGRSSPNGGTGIFGHGIQKGVYGESVVAQGVYGTGITGVEGSGSVYGVKGQGGAFGVYAQGNLGASGTKSFRIDHPLDPLEKYLYHYSAEGPEPQNFYNGNVLTDGEGCAWVELPSYFSAINRNFRYTLTVVDDSDDTEFVMAKVAKKIQGNRFKIRTSKARVQVSWRVDADRNDRWVQAHGAPVEVEKTGSERGRYSEPDLYRTVVTPATK